MAARVSLEELRKLHQSLEQLCHDLDRDHAMVMNQANGLHWRDETFRRMLGFLEETMNVLQMVKDNIEAYLPTLMHHVNSLDRY